MKEVNVKKKLAEAGEVVVDKAEVVVAAANEHKVQVAAVALVAVAALAIGTVIAIRRSR